MNYQDKFTVTLGEYKGITYAAGSTEVTVEELKEFLNRARKENAQLVEINAPAENGDTVVIDFAGFVGDDQFEGGTAENYELQLGSGSFIPGFEEQLVASAAGDEVDVNVTFPEAYHSADLAGKPAVFKCKVHAVKRSQIPDLTDEFAQQVYGLENVAALRQAAHNSIAMQKAENNRNAAQNTVMSKIIEAAEVEIAEAYHQDCIRQLMNYFRGQLASQGLDMDTYYQYTGTNEEALKQQFAPQAMSSAKATAVLAAVAEAENITVSDEEVDNEIQRMADEYDMEADKLKESMSAEQFESLRLGMTTAKALKFVMDAAVQE